MKMIEFIVAKVSQYNYYENTESSCDNYVDYINIINFESSVEKLVDSISENRFLLFHLILYIRDSI